MSGVVETLAYGAVLPAALAVALAWICCRVLPVDAAERFALPVGLAAGFFAGYALTVDRTALVPQRHWQWLPYLSCLAAILGPIGLARGVSGAERRLLLLTLAVIAALLLVPSWASLQPARPAWIALVAAYFAALMGLMDSLPERLTGPFFAVALAMAAAMVALLVAVEVSLVFGQLAGIATAAIGGCFVSSFLSGQRLTGRSLIPVYVILVGGLAYVGTIEPDRPVFGILLAPAAPLTLWIFAAGPGAKLRGWSAAMAQAIAVVTLLAIAAGMVFLRGASEY